MPIATESMIRVAGRRNESIHRTPNSRLGSSSWTRHPPRTHTHMYGQQSEELPHHLALSITRILDLKSSPDTDPLDAVGEEFNVIDVVNGYFSDGAFASGAANELSMTPCCLPRGIAWTTRCGTGAARARRTGPTGRDCSAPGRIERAAGRRQSAIDSRNDICASWSTY